MAALLSGIGAYGVIPVDYESNFNPKEPWEVPQNLKMTNFHDYTSEQVREWFPETRPAKDDGPSDYEPEVHQFIYDFITTFGEEIYGTAAWKNVTINFKERLEWSDVGFGIFMWWNYFKMNYIKLKYGKAKTAIRTIKEKVHYMEYVMECENDKANGIEGRGKQQGVLRCEKFALHTLRACENNQELHNKLENYFSSLQSCHVDDHNDSTTYDIENSYIKEEHRDMKREIREAIQRKQKVQTIAI